MGFLINLIRMLFNNEPTGLLRVSVSNSESYSQAFWVVPEENPDTSFNTSDIGAAIGAGLAASSAGYSGISVDLISDGAAVQIYPAP